MTEARTRSSAALRAFPSGPEDQALRTAPAPGKDQRDGARPNGKTAALAVLRPLARFALAALAVLLASRLGLLAWQHERVAAAGELVTPLLLGLRFDLALIGAAVLLVLAPATPLFAFRRTAGLGRSVLALGTTLVFVAIVQTELATPSFIAEYDARPNDLYVEYLVYPREVCATLWGEHPVQCVLLAVSIVAAALLHFSLVRPARASAVASGPAALLACVAVLAVAFVVARSSLRHRPINPSVACFSADALVNTLALPSLYSVAYSAYEVAKHGGEEEAPYGDLAFADAVRNVRAEAGIAGDWDGTGSPTSHPHRSTRPLERPLNFVILLEESLGAEFVGSMGGLDLTPRLDALREEGLSFERLYATGTRSVRGIEAVVSGFPPTPSRSVVKLPRSQRGFFTLAGLLRSRGYHTSFVYGGEAHFDNMARFFTGNGFGDIVEQNEFADPEFEGSWGVSDGDLLRRAHEEFEARGDTPFFSLVFTSSNHAPWEFPTEGLALEGEAATRENAVRYADHALGEFFGLARASSYWERTVFLVVADHNSRVFGDALVPVHRFHVPAVFLGGTIEPEHVDVLASQIDLLPTALSLIGISAEVPLVGRDLTDPAVRARPGRALCQYHQSLLFLEEERGVVLRPGQDPVCVSWDGAASLVPVATAFPDLTLRARSLATFAHGVYWSRSYR